MVLGTPASSSRRNAVRARALRSLRELPTRRPEAPAPQDAAVSWELVDIDRYRVTAEGHTVGFIDVVGAVFVALAGPRYARAVEVLQTLDFATAVAAVAPADTA
jgi:hypothetical protein